MENTYKIKLKTYTWATEKSISSKLNDLAKKVQEGTALVIRCEEEQILVSEPRINGIYTLFLDEQKNVTKIVLW